MVVILGTESEGGVLGLLLADEFSAGETSRVRLLVNPLCGLLRMDS